MEFIGVAHPGSRTFNQKKRSKRKRTKYIALKREEREGVGQKLAGKGRPGISLGTRSRDEGGNLEKRWKHEKLYQR